MAGRTRPKLGKGKDGRPLPKQTFIQALQEAGEFPKFKDLQADLVSKGMPLGKAWYAAALEYGWEGENVARPDVDRHRKYWEEALAGKKSDKATDAEWVYGVLGRKALRRDELCAAPSMGAVGLLIWARNNQREFFASVFSKVGKKGEGGEGGDSAGDDPVLSLLEHVQARSKGA